MEIGANTGKMLQCANEEDEIAKNLNQISVSLQTSRKSLQKCLSTSAAGKIDSALVNAYQRLNKSRTDTQRLAEALRNVASIYETAERDIAGSKPTGNQISAAKSGSGKTSVGKAAGKVKKAGKKMDIAAIRSALGLNLFAQTGKSYQNATKAQKKINQFVKDLPEAAKVLIKKLYKDAVDDETSALNALKGVDDAYKIWSQIADGDYEKAIGTFIKKCGGSIITAEEGTNWTGIKATAIANTVQLALDQDSYLHKNYDKYFNKATDYFFDGNVAGFVSSSLKTFPQTIGKGFVDAACQTVSSVADSAVGISTGGLFTLTSINKMMYEAVGTSPGHIFNDVTKAISDGVDVMADEGIVKGTGALVDMMGDVTNRTISQIASIFS